MSKEHPTPWRLDLDREFPWTTDQPILDANGNEVLVRDSGVYPPDIDTCREIVEAVNERDKLRDLVRRLLMLRRGDIAVPLDMEKQIIADARAAIGEGK